MSRNDPSEQLSENQQRRDKELIKEYCTLVCLC